MAQHMWTIRQEQVDIFEQGAWRSFEDEMVVHSKAFSPTLCRVIGDEQLRLAIRSAVNRASNYRFTCRGPIRLFIEMMFLCGSAFDTDPQYPEIGKVLNSAGDEMARAQRIHEGQLDYLETVSGLGAGNVRRALSGLLAFAREPLTISRNDLAAALVREMTRIFPQKVAYTGEGGLRTLIDEGFAEAQRYGLHEVRHQGLLVVLMFAFGHGCTNDPLYPWIGRTLQDEKIAGPAARAERLEKKSVTWLEHVLARPHQGGQT